MSTRVILVFFVLHGMVWYIIFQALNSSRSFPYELLHFKPFQLNESFHGNILLLDSGGNLHSHFTVENREKGRLKESPGLHNG